MMPVAAAAAHGVASPRSVTRAAATVKISQTVLRKSADMVTSDSELRGLAVKQVQDAPVGLKSSALQ